MRHLTATAEQNQGENSQEGKCMDTAGAENDVNNNAEAQIVGASSPKVHYGMLSQTNLYIKGLDQTANDQYLLELCQEYGEIMSTKAIMDKNSNLCKGYGFVDFRFAGDAELAVKELQKKSVQAQMAKLQEQDPSNLYLANLPTSFDDHDLCGLLSPHGTVISTRVLKTPNGCSRGVGFARMESKDTCEKIIKEFNNKLIPGSTGDALIVKFADSGRKNKRQIGRFGNVRANNPYDGFNITSFDWTNHMTAVPTFPNFPAHRPGLQGPVPASFLPYMTRNLGYMPLAGQPPGLMSHYVPNYAMLPDNLASSSVNNMAHQFGHLTFGGQNGTGGFQQQQALMPNPFVVPAQHVTGPIYSNPYQAGQPMATNVPPPPFSYMLPMHFDQDRFNVGGTATEPPYGNMPGMDQMVPNMAHFMQTHGHLERRNSNE